jgi:hypothetical protein
MRLPCLRGALTMGTVRWSHEVARLAKRISKERDKKVRDALVSAMAQLVEAIQEHEANN